MAVGAVQLRRRRSGRPGATVDPIGRCNCCPQSLPALQRASAWALNYLRTACDAAETLWLLERRDHLEVVEAALRDKALPADFRWPMADATLPRRLCGLHGRYEEAKHWFAQARATVDAQGARPLRAIVDFDEALMHQRAGHHDVAQLLAGGGRPVHMAGNERLASARRRGRRGIRAARPALLELRQEDNLTAILKGRTPRLDRLREEPPSLRRPMSVR